MILLKLKKKLQDILDLDCPNFLSFNLQIDKYVEKYFDWPHDKSIIRIIMRRTFLNSMTSAIILLLKFIVKLVCSYYRCANVQIGRATYSCTKGIININYPWMYSLLWNLKCLGISICSKCYLCQETSLNCWLSNAPSCYYFLPFEF